MKCLLTGSRSTLLTDKPVLAVVPPDLVVPPQSVLVQAGPGTRGADCSAFIRGPVCICIGITILPAPNCIRFCNIIVTEANPHLFITTNHKIEYLLMLETSNLLVKPKHYILIWFTPHLLEFINCCLLQSCVLNNCANNLNVSHIFWGHSTHLILYHHL